ncbi:MAG: hypothetical protein RLZZ422_1497 [Pseudomonadota bacterium]|jgi:hypothetical protein
MKRLLLIALLINTNAIAASSKNREINLPNIIDSFCIEKPKGKVCLITYENGKRDQITYDRKGNIISIQPSTRTGIPL